MTDEISKDLNICLNAFIPVSFSINYKSFFETAYGLVVEIESDFLLVHDVVKNTLAYESGVKPGAYIKNVNNKQISKNNIESVLFSISLPSVVSLNIQNIPHVHYREDLNVKPTNEEPFCFFLIPQNSNKEPLCFSRGIESTYWLRMVLQSMTDISQDIGGNYPTKSNIRIKDKEMLLSFIEAQDFCQTRKYNCVLGLSMELLCDFSQLRLLHELIIELMQIMCDCWTRFFKANSSVVQLFDSFLQTIIAFCRHNFNCFLFFLNFGYSSLPQNPLLMEEWGWSLRDSSSRIISSAVLYKGYCVYNQLDGPLSRVFMFISVFILPYYNSAQPFRLLLHHPSIRGGTFGLFYNKGDYVIMVLYDGQMNLSDEKLFFDCLNDNLDQFTCSAENWVCLDEELKVLEFSRRDLITSMFPNNEPTGVPLFMLFYSRVAHKNVLYVNSETVELSCWHCFLHQSLHLLNVESSSGQSGQMCIKEKNWSTFLHSRKDARLFIFRDECGGGYYHLDIDRLFRRHSFLNS